MNFDPVPFMAGQYFGINSGGFCCGFIDIFHSPNKRLYVNEQNLKDIHIIL
jgi:hypothetical protein